MFIRLASPAILRLRPLSRLAAAALVVLVAACASRAPAPVEERATRPPRPAGPVAVAPAPSAPVPEPEARPQTYTVKRGDTLYKIALDHGLDYRELAAWNSIENVNVIREGQVLRLTPPVDPNAPPAASGAAGVTTVPLRSAAPPVAADARAPSAAPGPIVAAPTAVAPSGTRNTESYKSQPKALKEPYSEQALREVQRNAVAVQRAGSRGGCRAERATATGHRARRA